MDGDYIIKRVLLTEKGSKLAVQNRYILEVDRAATKPEIRAAVEKKFGVHVQKVRTATMKSGVRTIRGTRFTVSDAPWKRAIVTVKAGERIETL